MAALEKEKSWYVPVNGVALIEFEMNMGRINPIKVHEINFSERIYSHRKEIEAVPKAIDKTFVSGEQQQKLIKLSQDLCFNEPRQTEPTESLAKDYFLSIRFTPLGKKNPLVWELYFNRRLERKGRIRDIFDYIMNLEKAASELR
jgi:hypothetical protein